MREQHPNYTLIYVLTYLHMYMFFDCLVTKRLCIIFCIGFSIVLRFSVIVGYLLWEGL